MRIALWGGGSLDNVGDQVLMEVAERELRRRIPDCTVVRFCPWSDGPPAEELWIHDGSGWPGAGAFDAVVGLGGIWAGPPFRAVLMQVFTFGPDPAAFDPAAFVAWHGVGLVDGCPPLEGEPRHRYVRALAGRLDHLTVRGRDAADRFAAATGSPPAVVPDPAFALPPWRRSERRRPRVAVAVGDARPAVGLSRRLADTTRRDRWCAWHPDTGLSFEEMLEYEVDAVELDWKEEFLPRLWPRIAELAASVDVEFLGVTNMYEDDDVARQGAAAVDGSTLRQLGRADADTLTRALGEYDAVVVSRFHSVVLAMRAGVPLVAVDPYWSPRTGTSKVQQLLTAAGLADRLVDDETDLAALVARIRTDGPVEASAYERMHRRALADFDVLAERMRGSRRPRSAASRAGT